MRDAATFFLNGRRRTVQGPSALGSLTDYLRDDLGLVGTKIGCGEGDCGACTVLIGRVSGRTIRYLPATSCILTPCQVDGAHVVTVEGLRRDRDTLTPIQAAMVAHHGSQCGYCTPGFVVGLTGLFEADKTPCDASIRTALTGNLCRCTGYLPILEAARAVSRSGAYEFLTTLYPEPALVAELTRLSAETLRVESADDRIFFRPTTAAQAIAFRVENPGAVILSGGTDLGVWRNRRGFDPTRWLSISGVQDWSGFRREGKEVAIGANATWTDLEAFAAREAPSLQQVTDHFAAPPIRNVATFVGNVAGGSPIADAVAFLHVLGARLELVGPQGTRSVTIGDFFTGYRQTVLRDDEIVARLFARMPTSRERLGLYKVSKRKEMDISTFRAAILIGERSGQIDSAALAFAGVGPKVLRLPQTEEFLIGQPLTEETFRQAGRRAAREIEPISDLRGSRDHRLILSEKILLKFFHEHIEIEHGGPLHAG